MQKLVSKLPKSRWASRHSSRKELKSSRPSTKMQQNSHQYSHECQAIRILLLLTTRLRKEDARSFLQLIQFETLRWLALRLMKQSSIRKLMICLQMLVSHPRQAIHILLLPAIRLRHQNVGSFLGIMKFEKIRWLALQPMKHSRIKNVMMHLQMLVARLLLRSIALEQEPQC